MKKLAALLAALALAAPAAAPAAVLNDEVTSVKLKEADNTASQDTNSGSGVKTGHLQNKAVTAAKLADGAVGATQLAAGAVTQAKLGAGAVGAAQLAPAAVGTAAIADGAITAAKLAAGVLTPPALADGSVTTPKLADGAVTDAKITGPISAGKLGAHGHAVTDVLGLDALLAGKADAATVYGRFNRVIVVSDDGRGDFLDPSVAVAAITDASPTNRYLVKVLPGTYLPASAVVLPSYVDLEGSGAESTRIVSSYVAVKVNSGSTVRDITLENNAGPNDIVVVSATAAPARFEGVTFRFSSDSTGSTGQSTIVTTSGAAGAVFERCRFAADTTWIANQQLYLLRVLTGSVLIRDCDFKSTAANYVQGLYLWAPYGYTPPMVEIWNTRIDLYGENSAIGIAAHNGTHRIHGTSVTVKTTYAYNGAAALSSSGDLTFDGGELLSSGPSPSTIVVGGGVASLANVKVDGRAPVVSPGLLRCFNLYNGSYTPYACP